ncbi:prepilin peptidase [Croceicoccus bisphenolivorans]|uniref:prepilin peptidase n=1 Tax=Croceicoccus bisphenolivorans TaxID=1783232 RepID=UPI00082DD662|nr:A24 family peptidase [Croceicoccus bisphenolivorans]
MILAGGGIGLLVGSFVGAAAMRLPRDEGIVAGRSHCDSCKRPLSPLDLVPVLSYVFNRGRCRTCGARIDALHLIAELGGAFVGLSAMGVAATVGEGAAIAILGWQLLLLAILDGRHFWLPPRAIALLAASALLLPVLDKQAGTVAVSAILDQVAGGALGFALLAAPALLYRFVLKRDGLGSADPWLLGAIGLWVGVMNVVLTLLLAAFAGLVLALFLKLAGRQVGAESALPLGTLMGLSAYALMIASRVT